MDSIYDRLAGVNRSDLVLKIERADPAGMGELVLIIANSTDEISRAGARQGWAGDLWMHIPNKFTDHDDARTYVWPNAVDHYQETLWAAAWVAARLLIETIELPSTTDGLFERLSIACDEMLYKSGRDDAQAGLCVVSPRQMPFAYWRGYKQGGA